MKQLLAVDKWHAVVGLDDRAFIVIAGADHDGKSSSHTSTIVVQELQPTPFEPPRKQQKPDEPTHNPVQAVAVHAESDHLWCAVARYDKSLAVYQVAIHNNNNPSTPATTLAPPRAIHATAKRASSLCFAQVPAAPDSSNNNALTVVIAGDLAGDAVAFDCLESSTTSTTAQDDDDDDPMLLGTASRHSRLLLGHTASMLTAVRVVSHANAILTADRDEKIRVSAFPDAHSIRGYLLGHTAFVAALDVLNNDSNSNKSWAVSWGGDHTLRLWDCSTCQQLAVASIKNEEEEDGAESNEKELADKNDNNTAEEEEHANSAKT